MKIHYIKQEGSSLIELMISVSLSLVFILGAFSFLTSSKEVHSVQETAGVIQDNARYVIDELSSSIRMAGYYNLMSPGVDIPAGPFYFGPCGSFANCTVDGSTGADNFSDRIAVMLNPPQDDGTDHDCIGNPLSSDLTTAANSVAIYQYRIMAIGGVNTLVCETYLVDSSSSIVSVNEDPYELVPGIDSIQFLYGVSQSDTSNVLSRYVSANELVALTSASSTTNNLPVILTVKMAVLVGSGENDKAGSDATQSYELLNAPPFQLNDRNLRSIYSATVLLNNTRA